MALAADGSAVVAPDALEVVTDRWGFIRYAREAHYFRQLRDSVPRALRSLCGRWAIVNEPRWATSEPADGRFSAGERCCPQCFKLWQAIGTRRRVPSTEA